MAKILKTTISKENWHTSKAERRAYLIGEIGRCCEGGIVTSFMTLFLVFQGIDLKLVAGVMLAVKIIDALDDVIFGYFIDRLHVEKLTLLRKITGEGKYLPWFRLTFALFPLFTILFFLMPTSLSCSFGSMRMTLVFTARQNPATVSTSASEALDPGHRKTSAPRNIVGNAWMCPEYSVPAIGCPPTNTTPRGTTVRSAAFRIAPFTLPMSVTMEPGRQRCA